MLRLHVWEHDQELYSLGSRATSLVLVQYTLLYEFAFR